MFAQLIYFLLGLVVVMSCSSFDLLYVYAAAQALLMSWVLRFVREHHSRWIAIAVTCVLQASAVYWWSSAAGLDTNMQWGLIVFVAGALLISAKRYSVLLGMSIAILPILGLLHTWLYPWMGGDGASGTQLLCWCVLVWPMMAAVQSEKVWNWVVPIGCVGAFSAVWSCIELANGRAVLIADAIVASCMQPQIFVLSLMAVVIVMTVGSVVIRSRPFWRACALTGLLFAGGLVGLALISGPWIDGWPSSVPIGIGIGIVATCVGVIGMLCTAHSPEVLSYAIHRVLILGCSLSVVALLALLAEGVQAGQGFATALAASVAPLVYTIFAAVLIGAAQIIAAWRHRAGHTQDVYSAYLTRYKPKKLRDSASAYVSGLLSALSPGARGLLSADIFVPSFVFSIALFALYPVLGWLWIPVGATLVGIIAERLRETSLLLWMGVNSGVMLIAFFVYGASLIAMFGLVSIAVVVAWIFVRWNVFQVGWAYPATLLPVCLVWVSWMGIADQRSVAIVMSIGLVVLCANALYAGAMRYISLPITTVAILAFMAMWIPMHDRFVLAAYDDLRFFGELGEHIIRAPAMMLILMIMTVSRIRRSQQAICTTKQCRLSLLLVLSIVGSLWLMGYRPNAVVFILLLCVCGLLLRRAYRVLVQMSTDHLRLMVFDGLLFMLASALMALGSACEQLYSGSAALQHGGMGNFIISAERDIGAIFAAMTLIGGIARGGAYAKIAVQYSQQVRIKIQTILAERKAAQEAAREAQALAAASENTNTDAG